MNKGKERTITISETSWQAFLCNRCGVLVAEEDWKGDNHENCDRYLKGKAIRERAEKGALGALFGRKRR